MNKTIIKLILILILASYPFSVLAHQDETGDHMMGFSMMSNNWGWMGFGWLFMIAFWILIFLGIIWLIKNFANQNQNLNKDSQALEILKQRYAKGEINKQEFEEKKKDLN